jgi:hypothetical protein
MIKFILFNAILFTIGAICYINGEIAIAAMLFGISLTNIMWIAELQD